MRTVRFFAYGATISTYFHVTFIWNFGLMDVYAALGPILGRWNAFLESRFPLHVTRAIRRRPNAAGGLVRPAQGPPPINYFALAKRVATDQLIMYVPLHLTG
jgi:hypothetical protein